MTSPPSSQSLIVALDGSTFNVNINVHMMTLPYWIRMQQSLLVSEVIQALLKMTQTSFTIPTTISPNMILKMIQAPLTILSTIRPSMILKMIHEPFTIARLSIARVARYICERHIRLNLILPRCLLTKSNQQAPPYIT
jgi:hypothetical protein